MNNTYLPLVFAVGSPLRSALSDGNRSLVGHRRIWKKTDNCEKTTKQMVFLAKMADVFAKTEHIFLVEFCLFVVLIVVN